MFGMLKNIAAGSMAQQLLDKVTPDIKVKLQEILTTTDAQSIIDNGSFSALVVVPIKQIVIDSANGATSLVSNFDDIFEKTMQHLRDELMVIKGDSVFLADNFDADLSSVLKAGYEKAKSQI